jgi:hypothetical protein
MIFRRREKEFNGTSAVNVVRALERDDTEYQHCGGSIRKYLRWSSSFLDNVSIYFDQAASFTEYPKGLLDQIKVCNSVYSFKFPVRTSNGYESPQVACEGRNQILRRRE